jgi:hypothetical protein
MYNFHNYTIHFEHLHDIQNHTSRDLLTFRNDKELNNYKNKCRKITDREHIKVFNKVLCESQPRHSSGS